MPGDPRIRASDKDRERTAELLREHHAQGRLTPEEFDERVDRTFTAKTIGDLPAAGVRPAPPGALRPRGSAVDQRGKGVISSRGVTTWAAWAAISTALLVAWLGVGLVSGGAAWIPWFLLIVVPWALAIARRQARE
jgi:hypothetical protein